MENVAITNGPVDVLGFSPFNSFCLLLRDEVRVTENTYMSVRVMGDSTLTRMFPTLDCNCEFRWKNRTPDRVVSREIGLEISVRDLL
jgi:hypothetical protein